MSLFLSIILTQLSNNHYYKPNVKYSHYIYNINLRIVFHPQLIMRNSNEFEGLHVYVF